MHRLAGLGLILVLLSGVGCTPARPAPEPGVSHELALTRFAQFQDPQYRLHFDLPSDREAPVQATETLTVQLSRRSELVLDFRENPAHLHTLCVNGDTIAIAFENEHIIIPKKSTRTGSNEIVIDFEAGTSSLNRRDEFLYTLLVPDRARTLFPCFSSFRCSIIISVSNESGWS